MLDAMTWLWAGVLIIAIWAVHWGAERIAKPLKNLRKSWGLSEVSGAAFVGLAAASPEIAINTVSAVRGAGDIGLGTSLGSNIYAIPTITLIAYIASRKRRLGGQGSGENASEHKHHEAHRCEGVLAIPHKGGTVQALPYLGIVGLFALLTVPAQWRGLQPVDGWILLAGYAVYLTQAVWRGRKEPESVEWKTKEIALAAAGVLSLAAGAFFSVRATQNIVSTLGIPAVTGGLFITAPMAMLPEAFAVWSVTRSGQVTAAATSVFGDHAVTMTIAFLPLALTALPVQNVPLFLLNLAFVAAVPATYAVLLHWGSREHGLKLWQALTLVGIAIVYICIVAVTGLAFRNS